MSRIRLVSDANATEEERAAIADLRKPRPGPLINVHAAILNAPSVIGPFIALADALRHDTQLDPALRELAILSALKVQGSRYEFLRHWKLALVAGVDEAKLLAFAEDAESGPFSDLERSVLRLAREVTAEIVPSQAAWDAVYGALGDRRTVELLLNLGLYNMTARLTEPIGLEDEPGFVAAPGSEATFERAAAH